MSLYSFKNTDSVRQALNDGDFLLTSIMCCASVSSCRTSLSYFDADLCSRFTHRTSRSRFSL